MEKRRFPKTIIFAFVVILLSVAIWIMLPGEEIDYNTQVKPIINSRCISCHGGVKQNGGFSLLFEEQAKGKTKSGAIAIIPGHPGQSEMIRRILSNDPEERMPYEKAPLTKNEIHILKKWIKQGAKWETHWAYIPVQKTVPDGKHASDKQLLSWKKNDIDDFIFEKAKNHGLTVSEPADLPTLARTNFF